VQKVNKSDHQAVAKSKQICTQCAQKERLCLVYPILNFGLLIIAHVLLFSSELYETSVFCVIYLIRLLVNNRATTAEIRFSKCRHFFLSELPDCAHTIFIISLVHNPCKGLFKRVCFSVCLSGCSTLKGVGARVDLICEPSGLIEPRWKGNGAK